MLNLIVKLLRYLIEKRPVLKNETYISERGLNAINAGRIGRIT
jgi:hypothetical protein